MLLIYTRLDSGDFQEMVFVGAWTKLGRAGWGVLTQAHKAPHSTGSSWGLEGKGCGPQALSLCHQVMAWNSSVQEFQT